MNHDHIIDAVARQMTEADPPPDLRARVIAALPATRRPLWLRVAMPASAIAALTVAALVIMMNGAAWRRSPQGATVQKSVAAVPAHQVTDPPTAASSESTVAAIDASAGLPIRRAVTDPNQVTDLPLPSRVAPLEDVTPLSISPIQPIGLSIAPITVTPLVTEPLAVPVLDSRSGGRE